MSWIARRGWPQAALLGVLGLGGCSTFGLPPPPYLPDTPQTSDYPDVGAVILEDVATVAYRRLALPEGEHLIGVLDQRRRLKITEAAGLAAATVELPIDGYTTIRRVVARSIDTEGHITQMPQAALQAVPRRLAAEQAPDIKTLRFTVPAAVVGGIVEYRYERLYTDAWLMPPYVFSQTLPVLRAELQVEADDAIQMDYRYGQGETPLDQAPLRRDVESGSGLNRLLFVETALPPLYHEPFMPDRTRRAPWLAVTVRDDPTTSTLHRLQNWQDVSALLLARMMPLQAAAAQQSSQQFGGGTAATRYHRLMQKLHPVQLYGLGVRPPQEANALLHGEPACSRDAAALLLGVLQDAGVEAHAVLLANAQAPLLQNDFPALYPFTQVGVAVKVQAALREAASCGGDPLQEDAWCAWPPESYFLVDPLCQACAWGQLPPALLESRALLLDAKHAVWLNIPAEPPQRHVLQTRLQLILDVDGSLNGSLKAQMRGTPALQWRQTHLRLASPAPAKLAAASPPMTEALTAALTQHLFLGQATAELPQLTGAQVNHLQHWEQPLTVQGHVHAVAQRTAIEHFQLSVANLSGSSVPAAWRGSRHSPAILEAPWWRDTQVEIQLPVGYEVSLPPPFKQVSEQAEYAATFRRQGRQLFLTRRFVVKVHRVERRDWDSLQTFLQAIEAYERTGAQVWSAAN